MNGSVVRCLFRVPFHPLSCGLRGLRSPYLPVNRAVRVSKSCPREEVISRLDWFFLLDLPERVPQWLPFDACSIYGVAIHKETQQPKVPREKIRLANRQVPRTW